MKKQFAVMAAAAALAAAAVQPAAAREFADIYTECGLGAMIAPNNTVVAAITNVTWDLGTTAISSNASSPETCQGGKAKAAAFIHDAYPQLAQDLARGRGQHLQTLVTLAGCSADAQPALVQAVRADFAQIAAQPGYAQQPRQQQAAALYDALQQRTTGQFAGACTA
jgi:hypothetical protein